MLIRETKILRKRMMRITAEVGRRMPWNRRGRRIWSRIVHRPASHHEALADHVDISLRILFSIKI